MKKIKTSIDRMRKEDQTQVVTDNVREIIDNVKKHGDTALRQMTKQFDGVGRETIFISKEEVQAAYGKVEAEVVEHLRFAGEQIRFYAAKQMTCLTEMETASKVPGVTLGHRMVPVDRCGCYVPGGRYPLLSSALMSIIPAKVAGVGEVVACSPGNKAFGTVHPAVLVAMDIAGADKVYCMGGAQAIAALTFGTDTVPKVGLIVGPGNKYVTEAKRQLMGNVGIDSLAGPSEVLVIADETANPKFLAIDLLAQCEHDPDAKAVLVSTYEDIFEQVDYWIHTYASQLDTGKAALEAWKNHGEMILADTVEEAVAISDAMAPEHLEIHCKNGELAGKTVRHYGSLFIGPYTPVTFGDYVSGTNHILPTMGNARFSNGLWVGSFLKTSFYQHVTEEGCRNLSQSALCLSGLEGLSAHKHSISVRLEAMDE